MSSAIALGLAVAGPLQAAATDRWQGLIEEASIRFGIPARWIEQVIRAESGGQTTLGGRPIRSSAGAIGLMQLMPATWESMRTALRLGPDPDDPRDNILAGTFFLRLLYDRFGYPGLFAAYNAGPARYARHIVGGQPLPTETRAYVAKVAGVAAVAPQQRESLFAVRRAEAEKANDAATPRSLLFVVGGN